jgi:hypothetical protein
MAGNKSNSTMDVPHRKFRNPRIRAMLERKADAATIHDATIVYRRGSSKEVDCVTKYAAVPLNTPKEVASALLEGFSTVFEIPHK